MIRCERVWVLVAVGVVLLAVVPVLTNPVKAQPFEPEVSTDPVRLRSDTPDTLDYEKMAHVVTGVYAAVTSL